MGKSIPKYSSLHYKGLQYDVIQASDNGDFQEGDKVVFTQRGEIICSSGIWVKPEDAESATKGWKIERNLKIEQMFHDYCVRVGWAQPDKCDSVNQLGLS